jgi:golgin subfamily B member 1
LKPLLIGATLGIDLSMPKALVCRCRLRTLAKGWEDMTKKDELLKKLIAAPVDRAALDNLVAFYAQRADFQALYEVLQEVVEAIGDKGVLSEFSGKLVDIVRRHLDHAEDAVMAASIKLRLAGLLFERSSSPKEALILVTEAFERLPSEEAAQRAIHMLREMKLSSFVVMILKRKAAAELESDRRPDTLFQLGHAALSAGKVEVARGAFEELSSTYQDWSEKAQEGLKQTEGAISALESKVEELTASIGAANDVERPVLKSELGRNLVHLGQHDDGVSLLKEVFEEAPSDDVFMELVEALKELENWPQLIDLVDQWAELVEGEDARRELLKERVRLYAIHMGDTKKGFKALEELYKRHSGEPDVVEFCVDVYSECGDFDALAKLLGRARQDTRNRDHERRYLEWEAALKWRKLEDLDGAEKLYRRIKSIDPRNEAALLFYEEFSRAKGDFRKLYSILSTRQSLAPDSQKVRILKNMAAIAESELSSPDRAIDALKKVLVLKPDEDEAFDRLGELLQSTRRWHAVIEHYSSKVDRLPEGFVERKLALLKKIREIYSDKDKLPVPEMVVTTWRRMLAIEPKHAGAIAALSEYYRKSNRWGELTEILERSVELAADAEERMVLHKEIAQILVDYQHQEGAAIPHLEKVVELRPDDDEALKLLARAYRGRGEFEKFFTLGKQQLSYVDGREKIELLEELSTIALERLKQEDEGAELLEQLFDESPKHPWALRRLRQLFEKLERFEELADLLERGIKAVPAAKQRSLKEKLGLLLSDKLARYDDARRIFYELLEENPGNRHAKKHLQNILAQAGDFADLEKIYKDEKNLPGLMRFLDEFRTKESEPERARAAGLEMVRVAEELLKDKSRARQTLEAMLDQFPADARLATMLLERYPARKKDMEIARALGVVADHAEGPEAREAAVQLGDVLEKIGEHEAAFTRTLGLFLELVREGNLSLLDMVVDRAERAEALENLTQVMEDILTEEMSVEMHEELVVQFAAIFQVRLKDLKRSREILEVERKRTPDSVRVLQELERIYMSNGEWEALEDAVRAKADLMLDLEAKKVELHKLARLYEEIIGEPEKAGGVYSELRELDPEDEEAYAGLKRVYEELEKWEELAAVLEDELQTGNTEIVRDNLMQLGWVLDDKLADRERAAETYRLAIEKEEDNEEAWQKLTELFDRDEALAVVIPMLEAKYRTAGEWEALVQVLAKKAQVSEDEVERFETLGQCVELLIDRLKKSGEAFSYLTVMASMNASEGDVIPRLDSIGRSADRLDDLYDVYKGLLRISDSTFEPQTPLDESREQEVSLLLADLAEEKEDYEVAIEAVRRARLTTPSDVDLVVRLEDLYEGSESWEELLELLEEKREYVWEDDAKIGLYARISSVLSTRLDREEESIPWVEELYALAGQSDQVGDRLEDLYIRYERWNELPALLQTKLARLEGEERLAVSYQLAVIHRDHLQELERAYELFSEIVDRAPDHDEAVTALEYMLSMKEAPGYDGVVLSIAALLEPIAREHEDWKRLSSVLEVKAERTVEPVDAAVAWLAYGRVCRDQLAEEHRAFAAFVKAVLQNPASTEALQELTAIGESMDRSEDVIQALEAAMGDLATATEPATVQAYAGLVHKQREDLHLAAAAYERLQELSPEILENYQILDEIYTELKDVEGRIRVLGEMVERVDGREQAALFVTLGELQYQLNLRDDAVDTFYRALENPDLLEEDRRSLAFHLSEESLEEQERWFDLCEVVVRRLRYATDSDERKALLFRAASLEEERLENPDNAIKHYFAIIDQEPLDEVASEALFRLLETTGQHPRLEDLLATQVELVEDETRRNDLLLRLAQVRLFELVDGDLAVDALTRLVEREVVNSDVIGLLDQVIETFPEAGFRATQLLESAYRQTESFDKLAEIFRTQIDRYADEVDKVERYRELASLYEERFTDIDAAFLYISQAFKLEPSSEAIHEQLVRYANERASFDELFDIYLDVLVQLDEADGRNNLRKKMVHIYHDEQQDLEHAELIYRDMLDDEPGNDFAIERLQSLYKDQENFEQLIEVMRLRIENTRSDKVRIATLYEVAAIHREKLEQQTEALDCYEQILGLDSQQWDAYRGIESLHFERSDPQGVVACLRRELDVREAPEERREVRLRLAAILFTEQELYLEAVAELDAILAEAALDEAALELLREVVDAWDEPSDRAIELLVEAYTGQEEWDVLIGLYQKLAVRAVTAEGKRAWFEQIYDIRTSHQDDHQGAYAATKIMLTLDPASESWRDHLLAHADVVGDMGDLVSFLEGLLEHESVEGNQLEARYQFLLADVLEMRAEKPEESVLHFEAVTEGVEPALIDEARQRLRTLYQDLELWPKYVDLVEVLASETTETKLRRAYLLEAGQVARMTLEDHERAYDFFSQAAHEFPEDEVALDRYEQLLVEMEKADDLESLLRERIERASDPKGRADIRIRLGNLLLNEATRLSEGIEELLHGLEEKPESPVLWNILESLLRSDENPDEDRVLIARALTEKFPDDGETERLLAVLEVHLILVDDQDEENRLHKHMGELAETAGDTERAYLHMSQSLRLYPGIKKVEKQVRTLAGAAGQVEEFKNLLLEIAETVEEDGLRVRYLLEAARLEADELDSLDGAIAVYESVLAIDEYNRDALENLENYYEQQDKFDLIPEILERAISLEDDPARRTEKTLKLARLFTNQLDDAEKARQWWEEVVHDQEARREAWANLEQIYRAQEEWALLCDMLLEEREEVKDEDDLKVVFMKLAGLYEQYLDRLEEAFHWYRELLELDPANGAGLHGAKRCAKELEDWDTVVEVDQQLLASAEADDVADLQLELATLCLEQLERKEDGLLYLQSLLAAPEVFEEARTLALRHIQDPEVGFQITLTLEPVLEDAKDWERLIQLFDVQLEALEEMDEKVPIVSKATEVLVTNLKDSDRAFSMLATLMESNATATPLLPVLGALAEQTDDWQKYCDVLKSAQESAGTVDEMRSLSLRIAAVLEDKLEDHDGAISWYRQVLEDEPANQAAINRMEAILNDNERYDELVEFYEQIALDFEGNERTAILTKLGFLKEGQLDDPFGAVQAYREILTIQPDNPAALNRLDSMLDNPILALAVTEILEPIYRQAGDAERLARLLMVKAGEVEGSLDRAQLMAESASLLTGVEGRSGDAFSGFLQAIRQQRFDADTVLTPASELAEKLDRWQDLADALEHSQTEGMSSELMPEMLRRLAIIYMDKLKNAELAEFKLRELMRLEPENGFALNMLSRVLEEQGNDEEQLFVLEKLGDAAVEVEDKRDYYCRAAELATSLEQLERATHYYGRALRVAPDNAELMDKLGEIYRSTENWLDLVELLESRSNLVEHDEAVAGLLEAAHIAGGKLEAPSRALALCRMILERDDANREALTIMAEILRGQDKNRELQVSLEKLADLVDGDELRPILWELQELALAMEDEEVALTYVQRILENNPEDADALAAKIDLLRGSENLYNLVTTYEEQAAAAGSAEKKAELLYEAAITLADEIGDMAGALEKLTEIRAIKPDHLQSVQKSAQILVQQQEFEQALAAFLELAEIQEDEARRIDALRAAARIALDDLAEVEKALELVEKLYEYSLDDPEAFSIQVRALEHLERFEDLSKLLLDRIKRTEEPELRAQLCKQLAIVYRDGLGREDLFLNWTEEAHKAVEDPELVEELLAYYRDKKEPSRIAPLLEWKVKHLKKRKQMREIPQLLFELGGIRAGLNLADRALVAYRECVEIDGSFLLGIFSLATLLFDEEQHDEALSHLQTLLLRINELELAEQKVGVYLRLARIYLDRKDKKKAKTYLTRLLSIDKKNSEAKELLAQF